MMKGMSELLQVLEQGHQENESKAERDEVDSSRLLVEGVCGKAGDAGGEKQNVEHDHVSLLKVSRRFRAVRFGLPKVRNLRWEVPGQHRFFGFQEIDEADTPEELSKIKKLFGETHRLVGTKTHVPIAVPRTFDIVGRSAKKISDGVEGLSPTRHVVKAVVTPDGKPDNKFALLNTHFARDARRLAGARRDAHRGVTEEINKVQRAGLAAFLTGDLNSFNYRSLGRNETRLVEARLDYVRSYDNDAASPEFTILASGSVNLTIDGHNAHWVKVRVTW